MVDEMKEQAEFTKKMDELLASYDDNCVIHGPESYDAKNVWDCMKDLTLKAIERGFVPSKVEHPFIKRKDGSSWMLDEKKTDFPEAAYWYVRRHLEEQGIDWMNCS